ncbi:MAG: right-handed parallel beta-helix repeat-containing protein [Bacteroidetes bacterium]|nr:right-handed parallel beta-helix repeat-containing protein [Bacteroidota bacterium]
MNIRYAKFKENHIGLQFINYNQSPDNNATELGLLGIEFSCPDNVLSRAPFEGEQSLANIDLVDVVNVSIGGFGATPATPTTYQNKFADAIYGIRSQSSTAKIFNNEFTNIGIKEVICRLCEGAIFATDGSNLTIGGLLSGQNSNPFFRNYFKNSNVGIMTKGVNTILVQGNHFDKIGKGFIAHNASSSPITINENNEFYNVDNGIIAREITGIVTIEGNLFNPASLSTTDEFHYSSTAVTLQNYNDYATTTTNVIVSGNIIQDCRIGVHALNIPNISIGADMNSGIGNTITFTSEKGSYHCGIWIESCPSANIQGNEITKLSGRFSLEGITVTESADALINMNTITSADVPIHVFGNCSDTEFHCNYIDNQTEPGVGVVLDNAQLPDQGIKPSLAPPNGETWDNEWRGYTGSNYGVTGLPSQPFIWYFDVAQTYFDPNPDPAAISADALTSPDHFGCATLIANDDPDRDVRYGALVLDTLTFEDYSSEFIYKGKEQLYALIKSDTSILIRNTANDSVFTRFYNETMITNIALFDRVDSLILAGSLDPASDLNSSITDTNLIETNRKTVNDILINKVLMDVDLSATDSTTLEEIALQNPLTGGKAVYQARAILFLEVHYFNEALRLAHQLNETTNTVKTNLLASFELIPNPANDNCMVKFNEFNQKFVLQVIFIVKFLFSFIAEQELNMVFWGLCRNRFHEPAKSNSNHHWYGCTRQLYFDCRFIWEFTILRKYK